MPLRLPVTAGRRAEHDTAVDSNYLPRHVLGTLRAQPRNCAPDVIRRLLAPKRNEISYRALECKSRPILAAADSGAEVLLYFRVN
jgi:hypothetical protein